MSIIGYLVFSVAALQQKMLLVFDSYNVAMAVLKIDKLWLSTANQQITHICMGVRRLRTLQLTNVLEWLGSKGQWK